MFCELIQTIFAVLRDVFRGRAGLIAENALLRQQVVLSKVFPALLAAVTIERPETVIR